MILLVLAAPLAAQESSRPAVDCTDPSNADVCQQRQSQYPAQGQAFPTTTPARQATSEQNGRSVYVDSGGFPVDRRSQDLTQPLVLPPDPVTDFQRLAKQSTGETLPLYGRELFRNPPSTFAPADQIPVVPDYVLGPGDEVVLRIWGHDTFNGRLVVDRNGAIYIPQVGAVHVAGQHFGDLQEQIQKELNRTFRNYQMSVNLGQLRSIQVFVLGEARRPGTYTVSSLATAFNALLVSGGPTVQGSMRAIQVRRGGATIATIDLYDFVSRGDRTKDVLLQTGDVLFIPVIGAEVAVSGSVRHPAVFELLPGNTVADLLKLAGGLSSTASESRLLIERIEAHRDRHALSVALDSAGLSTRLSDGDVLHADSVLGGYKDSVTIRGNLANAGRFPWHDGMRVSEVIPDRESLLTNDYWRERNRLGLPTPLFEPLPPPSRETERGYARSRQSNGLNTQLNRQQRQFDANGFPIQGQGDGQDLGTADAASQAAGGAGAATAADLSSGDLSQEDRIALARRAEETQNNGYDGQRDGTMPNASEQVNRGSLADQQQSATDRLRSNNARRVDIRIPAPEIDWSYAVIERLDPQTLRNTLVPFNLGKLVNGHDAGEDKVLQPGDIITILSQADVHVNQDEQTKFIRLEGELVSSGVYSVGPNETLADVVARAGGLTPKAYLFGASFTRESARVLQQQRLDEYISSLSIQIERASSVRALSSNNPALGSGQLSEERALLEQMRRMRATGRVVLEFKPDSAGQASLPAIPLENGDSFRIPSRPGIVSVVGSVYGQNVFLYDRNRRIRDYLTLAGKPNRIADKNHAFVIRADGSVFSKETVRGGLWGDNFLAAAVYPGDTVVVPEKPIRPSALKEVLDYSQLFSQFAIGAAAINVVR